MCNFAAILEYKFLPSSHHYNVIRIGYRGVMTLDRSIVLVLQTNGHVSPVPVLNDHFQRCLASFSHVHGKIRWFPAEQRFHSRTVHLNL